MTELLSTKTLASLAGIKRNQFNTNIPTSTIVHIGIGAFHRAHQAVFTDDLLTIDGNKQNWKIKAVSLRSPNIRNIMQPQDNLYSVVERSNDGENIRIISVIDEVLVAAEQPESVINALADTQTQVVTLTVTEKGYCRDQSGKHLDFSNPVIVHDLANLAAPQSLPGFITAACALRKKSAAKLTIVSCDNLPSNGDVTKTVILEFAQKVDPALANWINENVSFCNSMVDRIVPATTQADIDNLTSILGVEDKSVVITEPFKQWVIEDNFLGDKPAWDKVGALFVQDVAVFEDMKLRLLNGAHSTLAYIGYMLGYEYIHQAITDKSCYAFVKSLHKQLLSTLENVPNIDLHEYADTILMRFSNEKVPYKTSQVACDGSQKLPQRLLKPAELLLDAGEVSKPIAFVIATWCRYLKGLNHLNEKFTVNDPLADKLMVLANVNSLDEKALVTSILRGSGICTERFLACVDIIDLIASYYANINQLGMLEALNLFVNETN